MLKEQKKIVIFIKLKMQSQLFKCAIFPIQSKNKIPREVAAVHASIVNHP
jgi:hypothetical protein